MLAIEEWGEKRFKPMVMLAHIVAGSAQTCYEVMVKSREAWLFEGNSAIGTDPHSLQRFYCEPLRFEAIFLQSIVAPEQLASVDEIISEWPTIRNSYTEFWQSSMRDKMLGRFTPEELNFGERCFRRIYKWVHLPNMRRMLEDNLHVPTNAREWLAHPALVFALKIAMPCWLEFQQTPWELYTQACQGDFEALEKLVRLDPEADKDDRLRTHVSRLRITNPQQYQLLNEARYKGRVSPISLANVKYLLGGLLMKWSTDWQFILDHELEFEIMTNLAPAQYQAKLQKFIKAERKKIERCKIPCRLKAPEIRNLFHAIAKDSGQGPVDEDFIRQPNSIFKRLERKAKLWNGLLETDKRRAA